MWFLIALAAMAVIGFILRPIGSLPARARSVAFSVWRP